MNIDINGTRLELIQGDITRQEVDAIVNSAAAEGDPAGGVDQAIRHVGGARLAEEFRLLKGRRAGLARLTTGGNLPARYVIHAFGPAYEDGTSGEAGLLSDCYRNTLRLAAQYNLQTIAFPSIATGVRNYPVEKAVPIALETVIDFLKREQHSLKLVRFVLFYINGHTYSVYKHVLQELSYPSSANVEQTQSAIQGM